MPIEEFLDLNKSAGLLTSMAAFQRVRWAYATFGEGLVSSTSGGKHSALLPDIVRRAFQQADYNPLPQVPVIFINTGYYTEETLAMVKQLSKSGVYIATVIPKISWEQATKQHPSWQQDGSPDKLEVEWAIKQEPLNRAFADLQASAWMSAVRADQTENRAGMHFIEYDSERKLYLFHPILDWTKEMVESYEREHGLPVNKNHRDLLKDSSPRLECGLHVRKNQLERSTSAQQTL